MALHLDQQEACASGAFRGGRHRETGRHQVGGKRRRHVIHLAGGRTPSGQGRRCCPFMGVTTRIRIPPEVTPVTVLPMALLVEGNALHYVDATNECEVVLIRLATGSVSVSIGADVRAAVARPAGAPFKRRVTNAMGTGEGAMRKPAVERVRVFRRRRRRSRVRC